MGRRVVSFDNSLHVEVLSEDGSYTAYSKEYNEHYHSTKDGALNESLYKHVYPAFRIKKDVKELNILDICFGLGFNTLATIFYHKQNHLTSKINIYSPELDEDLINSLKDFRFPDEFQDYKHIIFALVDDGVYSDDSLHVELFLGDAREYIQKFDNFFDVVYQDAFSPSTNPILWTKEYFTDIKKACKDDAVITTYSTSLPTRLALYENDYNLYINSGENFRNATVASLIELDEFELVNMKHKISCNPDTKSLRD